jgi:hypothetical protein
MQTVVISALGLLPLAILLIGVSWKFLSPVLAKARGSPKPLSPKPFDDPIYSARALSLRQEVWRRIEDEIGQELPDILSFARDPGPARNAAEDGRSPAPIGRFAERRA